MNNTLNNPFNSSLAASSNVAQSQHLEKPNYVSTHEEQDNLKKQFQTVGANDSVKLDDPDKKDSLS